MCGISGVVNAQRFTKLDVAKMIECVTYRGPDEQGVETVGPCILGHARLAVVDPENGGQPMSNTDDTVWVVFNGEIYNFIEIREGLKAKGYRFKSRCDTEVLVHLWREKGEAMLEDLIGMFSFFLWDTVNNKGILARDRQGIKPCYYMNVDGGLVFASEIKSILSLPGVNPPIDDIGLNMVHSFNYCLPPRTCYQGISHLEPGSYLLLDSAGKQEKRRYWHWPLSSEKKTVDKSEFAELLDDAVRMQMRFDVKGCLFLSGGVDSSIIAAQLRPRWNEPELLAFGLDCQVEGFGEYHLAKRVSNVIDVDLHPIQYDHNVVIDEIDAVLHHNDQPHGDFSFFLTRLLCKAAHDAGVIVAFNGDGPDEILSGFTHNEAFFSSQAGTNFQLADYFSKICFMPEPMRSTLLNDDFKNRLPDPLTEFEAVLSPWRELDPLDQIAAYESTVLAPGNNLIKTDRMGAGQSIEGRSPFLDHRVSEMLAAMPASQKFKEGYGKYFLKDYGLKNFDRDLMFRKKSMPTMPIGEWVKGPLSDWATDTLKQLDPGRYNINNVLKMLAEHQRGVANHTRELRTLLMASTWVNNT